MRNLTHLQGDSPVSPLITFPPDWLVLRLLGDCPVVEIEGACRERVPEIDGDRWLSILHIGIEHKPFHCCTRLQVCNSAHTCFSSAPCECSNCFSCAPIFSNSTPSLPATRLLLLRRCGGRCESLWFS